MPETTLFNELMELVPRDLYDVSGEIFHSGRTSFESLSPLYILGLNPGGDPATSTDGTVGSTLEAARTPARHHWSSYSDESWEGRKPGSHRYQRSVLHMLGKCGLDPRDVPSSNTVFVRTTSDARLKATKDELQRACWPVHEKVIAELGVRVVVCFGRTAGWWVRSQLGASEEVDSYQETNGRGWTSRTHAGRNGIQVITLTHPSRASWTNPAADPSELVIRALAR